MKGRTRRTPRRTRRMRRTPRRSTAATDTAASSLAARRLLLVQGQSNLKFLTNQNLIDFIRGLFCRGFLVRQLAACGSESGGEQWKGIEHFCGSINYGTNRTILLLEFVMARSPKSDMM